MVKHIVMWKLKENAMGADKRANAITIKKKLEALKNVVPGAYKMQVGIIYNPAGYDVVLYSEFNDQDALEVFRMHPEQIKFREFLHEVVAQSAVADYMV